MKIINNIKKSQESVIKILVGTVLISSGVNFVIVAIANKIENGFIIFLLTGIFLIILSIGFIGYDQLTKSNICVDITGTIGFDDKKHQLIVIPQYQFSEELEEYITCASAEDKNIKSLIEKHSFSSKENLKLFYEAIEYMILEELSTYTSDFFNKPNIKNNYVEVIGRENINDFVANNRFMNLFSKDYNERVAFSNINMGENIVRAYGDGGEMFSKFELNLPKGCKILRNNGILITHKCFNLRIIPSINGTNSFVSREFQEYYLGLGPDYYYIDYPWYKMTIRIEFKTNPNAIFLRKTEYYLWIETFMKKIIEDYSIEDFYKRINWDTVLTIIQCGNIRKES